MSGSAFLSDVVYLCNFFEVVQLYDDINSVDLHIDMALVHIKLQFSSQRNLCLMFEWKYRNSLESGP